MNTFFLNNFLLVSCIRLDPASTTGITAIIGSNSSESVIIATTPSPAPSANDPVSHIINLAGGTLNHV